MGRKKKRPTEWTTDEAMKHLFPKKVRDELYRVAHKKDDSDNDGASSQEDDTTDEA